MPLDLDELLRFKREMTSSNKGDHFLTLGIEVDETAINYAQLSMAYSDAIVGDPETGVIHGGSITSLLDTTCGFASATTLDELGLTPTIDLRIDYMRPATPGKKVIAEAEVYRSTEFVIFSRAIAHHGDKERPIARGVGNFFRLNADAFADIRTAFRKGEVDKLFPAAYLKSAPLINRDDYPLAADQELQDFKAWVPYANTLGMEILEGDNYCVLPPRQSNVGNFSLPALHGGAIAGFMEMSAVIAVIKKTGISRIPKIVDISVDYLRAGLFKDTYSRCKVNYLGQRMVNVSITAWQDSEDKPIANARAQFLLKD
ncbi:hypothetical protein IMCC21906_01565 [Spongiibacter sp. IMCC21906]|uniref:PaaI family thioesterase n=1 Tax=Spongiibacter sp. IMCC21906 TaxID=1620392 RepID=UPI00062DEB4C|nr:hotdog domain-containing protein [Spongiibacter sp. IMCC21906]AKH69243.1 hypothetical protein IMCC21906_01565 [Spongiibacter sp. IMCC21906]